MSALCTPVFIIKMKNHNCPFLSSFRAGVENKVVALLLFLSHIAKEQGALVSSIAEQYAHC